MAAEARCLTTPARATHHARTVHCIEAKGCPAARTRSVVTQLSDRIAEGLDEFVNGSAHSKIQILCTV